MAERGIPKAGFGFLQRIVFKEDESLLSSLASSWSVSRKKAFANDRSNHVSSCGLVSSSKGSEGPSDFLRRSRDGRGLEYEIVRFCEYVKRYHAVKLEYELSFESNSAETFASCGVAI